MAGTCAGSAGCFKKVLYGRGRVSEKVYGSVQGLQKFSEIRAQSFFNADSAVFFRVPPLLSPEKLQNSALSIPRLPGLPAFSRSENFFLSCSREILFYLPGKPGKSGKTGKVEEKKTEKTEKPLLFDAR